MRAVVCHQFGPIENLELLERPAPPCGRGQIRIGVEAAGVNFVDALFVQGRYQIKPPTPFVAGSEVAGTVTEIGEGAPGWHVGDRVLAGLGLGGFASEVVVRVDQVHRVPDGVDSPTAATLGQSYCTAWFALHHRSAVRPGDRVLVLGAGGGVGLAAIDVAKAAGAEVIAAASTAPKRELARHAGADHVIDSAADVKAAARELSGGGVDIAVDPVGGPLADAALRALGERGRLLVIGFASGTIPALAANQVLLRNRSVLGVDWGAWALFNGEEQRQLMDTVLGAVAAGDLRPIAPTLYPLEAAVQALTDIDSRRVAGKVALVP